MPATRATLVRLTYRLVLVRLTTGREETLDSGLTRDEIRNWLETHADHVSDGWTVCARPDEPDVTTPELESALGAARALLAAA